ncbi:MAG: damage-inducible protein DinB, partial [Rhodospirillaceae bacterium]|nr:damage-inducible protein DinB [Rhodospirillaceae bacterium]
RIDMDQKIVAWSAGLSDNDLAGTLTWYSGAAGRDETKKLAMLVAHFLNHQTHHRGQVHAMLTAAGATPGDTDLFIMPDNLWP